MASSGKIRNFNPTRIFVKNCNKDLSSYEYLGKSGLIPLLNEPVVFESNMMRFSINENILHPIFLIKLLDTKYIKGQILKCAKDAVNQSSINQQDVKSFDIIIPPLALQTQFAQIVEKTDALKAHYQNSLKELENLYGSLSQRAFRGELVFNQNKKVLSIEIDETDNKDLDIEKILPAEIKNDELEGYTKSSQKIISDFKPLPTKLKKIQQSYKIFSIIKAYFRNEYFTYESIIEKLVEKGHEYKFETIRDEIFNLLRDNTLKQVFADAAFKISFDRTHPDYNKVQNLKERIYLIINSEQK